MPRDCQGPLQPLQKDFQPPAKLLFLLAKPPNTTDTFTRWRSYAPFRALIFQILNSLFRQTDATIEILRLIDTCSYTFRNTEINIFNFLKLNKIYTYIYIYIFVTFDLNNRCRILISYSTSILV